MAGARGGGGGGGGGGGEDGRHLPVAITAVFFSEFMNETNL